MFIFICLEVASQFRTFLDAHFLRTHGCWTQRSLSKKTAKQWIKAARNQRKVKLKHGRCEPRWTLPLLLYHSLPVFTVCFLSTCDGFRRCQPQAENHFKVDRSSEWLTSGRAWTWLTEGEDDGTNNTFCDWGHKLNPKALKSKLLRFLSWNLELIQSWNEKVLHYFTFISIQIDV